MKIIFYSALQFPRVEYIVSILMNAMGLNEILFTQDQIIYEKSTAVKCNYSDSPIANQELLIQPSTLLFEKGVHKQNIEILEWNTSITNAYNHSKFKTLFYFFPTTKGDLPFDIFAASFYLLTRYEEYLPHNKDIYGRYAHENSLAFQFDFLKVPLVNLWLEELLKNQTEKQDCFHVHTFRICLCYVEDKIGRASCRERV